MWDRRLPTADPTADTWAEVEFSRFDDPNGYKGFCPSAHFLRIVFDETQHRLPVVKPDKFVVSVEGEVHGMHATLYLLDGSKCMQV